MRCAAVGVTAPAPPFAARALIPVSADVRLLLSSHSVPGAAGAGRHSMHRPGRFVAFLLAVLTVAGLAASGCRVQKRNERTTAADAAPYEAAIEEGLGAAIAVIVDTSGSMKDAPAGDARPKSVIAREAIEQMLDATDAFLARRPDFPIKIGLYSFSGEVAELRPIAPYDRGALRRALAALPAPGGGTAIGDAMREARPALYRAGVFRKYLLVVTDGENTRGRDP